MAVAAIALLSLNLILCRGFEIDKWHTSPTQPSGHHIALKSDPNNYSSQTSWYNPINRHTDIQKQNQVQTSTTNSTGYYQHIQGRQEVNNDSSETSNENDLLDRFHRRQQDSSVNHRWPPKDTFDDSKDDLKSRNNSVNLEHTNLKKNQTNDHNGVHIDLRPLSEGIPVSSDNWNFPKTPISPGGNAIVGGQRLTSDKAPHLQWHVGIYSRSFEPFMQICGGTLVTKKAVISAAHCFWSDLDGALPASRFLAAAGKLYRPWNDAHDTYAQKSEVSSVHLPPRYRGGVTSFQDDIAAVLLATEFMHSPALRPSCVLFDEDLEYTHLQKGKEGIVLGWGLTTENGPPAQALQFLYMPYVSIEECVAGAETNFLKYITSDKICAGVTTGKALCRGDSGGGLVFFDQSSTERVPILLGVASTAPRNEHLCNTHALATLTRVLAHRGFLRTHIPDIEEACGKNYISFASAAVQDDFSIGDRSTVLQSPQPQPPAKFICNCFCNSNSTNV